MIPPVPPTPKSRLRLIHQLTYLCVALMLTAGVLLAIIVSNHSNHKATNASVSAQSAATEAKKIANCVNDALGVRNKPSARDALAHVDFAKSLQKVLVAPKAQQAAEYQRFLTELNTYVHTLVADQQARDAKPLGKC